MLDATLLEGWDALYAIPENISVSDYVEREIHLPSKVSDNPGPINFRNASHAYECLEDFEDTSVTDVCNCFGSQTFKSTLMMCGLMERIDRNPINMLWIMANEKLAQSFSETKWKPMLLDSPAVAKRVPKNINIFEQIYDRCILSFLASGAKKNLKGRSAGIVVIDEPDDVEEEWAKRGESAIAMSFSRTKGFAGAKRFLNGTPGLPKAPTWAGFMVGDRRLRFVICPKCQGKPFVIEFDPKYIREWFPDVHAAKVVWDETAKFESGEWNWDKVEDSARLECPNCKANLTEDEKRQMCRRENGAHWVATNKEAPRGHKSRRLPSMYSPHESTTIGKTAVKFLKYLDTPGGLRTFINEELALPWQAKATTVLKSDIRAIVEHSPQYLLGQIPSNDLAAMILTIDVQVDSFWWVIRAWFGDKSSALVDYGQTFSYEDLVLRSNKKYPMSDGRDAACLFCLIDSGFGAKREEGIYKFCIDQGGKFFPTKGATEGQGMIRSVMETDVEFHGTALKLLRFSDPIFQYALSVEKIKQRAKNNWWLPRNIGKDLEGQLTSMLLKEGKNTRGFTENVWEAQGPNHLNDCEKQQLIMPAILEEANGLRALADKMKPAWGKVT